MKLTIYLLSLIFLISCSPKIRTESKIITIDSTIVNYTYKDTIIIIPSYKAELDGVVIKPDTIGLVNLKEVKAKSGKATVKVSIKDNILKASADCDSIEQLLKIREKEITNLRSTDKQTIDTVQVKYIPKWIKILAIIGGISIFLLIMRLIIFIAKLIK